MKNIKFFSFKKEEKNKIGRPKLADNNLKKKSIIMCIISVMLVVTLLVTGAFKLNIVSFNKMKGAANINLCTAENINPELLYNAETNPNGFSPEFLSVVMSVGSITDSYPYNYPYNDSSKCSTITMDELRQIKYLYDSGSSLTNTIGIQNLINLTILDLSYNALTSVDVKNLTNLTELDLSNNQLTDIELEHLTNLTELYLSNNQLTSIDVSNLTKVNALLLFGNKLTNIDLSNLSKLTTLYLYNNQLTSIDLSELTKLTDLSLSYNQLTSIGDISNLTNLTSLSLSSNKLTSVDVSELTKLTDLNLSYNQLTSIGDISNLTNLTSLYLSSNKLTGVNVSKLTKLKDLKLSYNQLTDIGNIENLTSLTRLYLNENQLTSISLGTYDLLKDFDISNNPVVQTKDIVIKNKNIKLSDIDENISTYYPDDVSCTTQPNNSIATCENKSLKRNSYGQTSVTIRYKVVGYYGFDVSYNLIFEPAIASSSYYIEDNIIYTKGKTFDENKLNYDSEKYTLRKEDDILKVLDKEENEIDSFEIISYNITSNKEGYNIDFENKTINVTTELYEDVQTYEFKIKPSDAFILNKNDDNETLEIISNDDNEVIDSFKIEAVDLEEITRESGFNDVNLFRRVLKTYRSNNRGTPARALTDSELVSIESLACFNCNISDLTGLEKLTGLTYLDLSNNKLTSIDVSNNINLASLNVSGNIILKSIDISNTKISGFEYRGNHISDVHKYVGSLETFKANNMNTLTYLDIGGQPNLKYVELNNNTKYYLDIYGNEMQDVTIKANKLQSLNLEGVFETFDLGSLPNLKHIALRSDNLNSIDLSKNKDLESLDVSYTKLTGTLDLSNQPKLQTLEANHTQIDKVKFYETNDKDYISCLHELDISNSKIKGTLDLSSFPYLERLYVNDNEIENIILYKLEEDKNIPKMDMYGVVEGDYDYPLHEFLAYNNKINKITNLEYQESLDSLILSNNNLSSISLPESEDLYYIDLSNNKLSGELDFSYYKYLYALLLQHNKLDNIVLYSGADSNLYILTAYDNNLQTIDLKNQTVLENVILDDNPVTNLYIPKGNKVDYNQLFQIFERDDITYNINENKIATYKDGIISALKVGKTDLLTIQSENILSMFPDYFDQMMYCEESDDPICDELFDNDDWDLAAYPEYFLKLSVNVYDIESTTYKIDKKNKKIDANNTKFDASKIKLTLDGLSGYVDGNIYYITDNGKIVDKYAIINQPNEKDGKVVRQTLKKSTNKVKLDIKDIEISGYKISALLLKSIEGKDRNIVLTNDGFTLTINGLDIKDINESIDLSHELNPVKSSKLRTELFDNVKDGYVLEFKKESNLPGKALIELNVGSKYKRLNSYLYKNGEFTLIGENLKVRNNKVKFYITKLGTYVLTDKLKDNKNVVYDDTLVDANNSLNKTNKLFIIVPIVLVLSIIGYIIYKKRK